MMKEILSFNVHKNDTQQMMIKINKRKEFMTLYYRYIFPAKLFIKGIKCISVTLSLCAT